MPTLEAIDQLKFGRSDVPVEELLLKRWSPRGFADKPLPEADLRSIFTAAAWTASSYNEQPWRFIVGRKGDVVWNKIFSALNERNQSWAGAAPVLYATFAKKTFTANGTPNAVAAHDTGAASANVSLQATALGIHTHGMAGFDREKLESSLAAPDDFDAVACWAMGYLGDTESLPSPFREMEQQPRARKAVSQFVFGAWDEPALP